MQNKRSDDEQSNISEQQDKDVETNDIDCRDNCKNMTMKSIRGALCRCFKMARCIDIIASESFIHANNIFKSVQNANKEVGLGVIKRTLSLSG